MEDNSQTIEGNNNSQQINNFYSHISNISSTLVKIMPQIAEIVKLETDDESDVKPYKIDDKISYNSLNTFKDIIEEYGQFGVKIDSLYDEYDNNNPGFKRSAFNYFKAKYQLKKQELHAKQPKKKSIEVVRANSDKIIRDIFDDFVKEIKKSNNLNVSLEDIETCALAITCHAFIQCKILEKPKDDN